MKNHFLLMVVESALIVAVALFAVNGCGGGVVPKPFITESVSYDLSESSPIFTNVYVDASGSMKGYFSLQSDGVVSNFVSQKSER